MDSRASGMGFKRGVRWRPRVLIVDDDGSACSAAGTALASASFSVEYANSMDAARSAITRAEREAISVRLACVLIEPMFAPDSGNLLAALRALTPAPAIGVVTRVLDNARELELKVQGVEICLRKPLRQPELQHLVGMLVQVNASVAAVASYGATHGLSERQQRVLWCALEGIPVKETARHLGVSPETVRTQWARMLLKTGEICPAAVVSAARQEWEEWQSFPQSA